MSEQMDLQLVFDLVDQSSKDLQKITNNLNKVKKGYDNATNSQKKMSKAAQFTTSVLKKQFNVLNTPLGGMLSVGAIGGFLGSSIKKSLEFADGLAEVSTLTNKSAKEITNSFKPVVNAIRTTYGKESQDVIKALYDGISSGVPEKEAAKYLEAVAKMSIGGRATMEESGDLITTIMNAWKTTGITAEEAANSIFGAVKMGKTTVAQLSASFGQVATDAAMSGASVKEVTAAVAALTSVGIKTPEAMTKLRGVLKTLKSPTEGAAKAFANLGIKSIGGMMQNFKGDKFVNTLQEIDKRIKKTTRGTDEYNRAVAKLFPDQEAQTAFTALMTTANDNFNKSLTETVTNGGQVSAAYKKMQTDARDLAKANEEIKIAMETVGDFFVPYLAETAKAISGIFGNIKLIMDNAAQIETINQEEKKQKTIEEEAGKAMIKNPRFGYAPGGTMSPEYKKEYESQKRIIEVRIESVGMKEADKKTASQIALEILPEFRKILQEDEREKERKAVGKARTNYVTRL